jgi:hypothetical protein
MPPSALHCQATTVGVMVVFRFFLFPSFSLVSELKETEYPNLAYTLTQYQWLQFQLGSNSVHFYSEMNV